MVREDDDHQPVGRYLDGTPISKTRLAQILCDSVIRQMTMRGSEILDLSKPTRTSPPPIWNAVSIRDGHCRFPGCDRPVSWCEAHHATHRQHGGSTAVTNLVLLCSRHHHVLHRPGWHAHLDTQGALTVTDPHGDEHTTYPPGHRNTLWPPGQGAA